MGWIGAPSAGDPRLKGAPSSPDSLKIGPNSLQGELEGLRGLLNRGLAQEVTLNPQKLKFMVQIRRRHAGTVCVEGLHLLPDGSLVLALSFRV